MSNGSDYPRNDGNQPANRQTPAAWRYQFDATAISHATYNGNVTPGGGGNGGNGGSGGAMPMGPDPPAAPINGTPWIETNGDLVFKVWDEASQQWLVVTYAATGGPYLPLTGGTISGNLLVANNFYLSSGSSQWRLTVESSHLVFNNPDNVGAFAINSTTRDAIVYQNLTVGGNIALSSTLTGGILRPNSIDMWTGSITLLSGQVTFQSLPTTDPNANGRLWNDGGTLKVSAG